jgi:pimeloyl-ACP methyl ester carboxylesterase
MSPNTALPVVVLVPGAWHQPTCYSELYMHLAVHSYETHTVALPSCGSATPSFDPDVAAIRKVLAQLCDDEGKDVVLVMHSFGGSCGSEAVKGFAKKLREKERKKGGVVRLVYIMAFAMMPGESILPENQLAVLAKAFNISEDNLLCNIPEATANAMFYADVKPEIAAKARAELVAHSVRSFWSKVSYAPFVKDVPSTWVMCESDMSLDMNRAKSMVAKAKEQDPQAFDVIERKACGHNPFLSEVEWLTGVVRRACGENV